MDIDVARAAPCALDSARFSGTAHLGGHHCARHLASVSPIFNVVAAAVFLQWNTVAFHSTCNALCCGAIWIRFCRGRNESPSVGPRIYCCRQSWYLSAGLVDGYTAGRIMGARAVECDTGDSGGASRWLHRAEAASLLGWAGSLG